MNKELIDFKNILRNCYSIDTAHKDCKINYQEYDCSYGQCAITSMLVYEKFGGTIHKINIPNGTHYFNIINGEIIDLTKEQFDYELNYSNNIQKTFDDLVKHKDTYERYTILKNKVNLYLIDQQIYNCNLCNTMVEHFPNSKTISIGKNNKIVILGEAPANNGWRKSGKAWYDINNKLLPSGVVMQRLLDIIDIKLEDTYFLEAIKCYPTDRKHLKSCGKNCKKFLMQQLDIINPTIVLSLGDAATKTILNDNYKKFSEVVGKTFIVDKFQVIPIYHPSPISPLSYKGNVPIFENIKEKICK